MAITNFIPEIWNAQMLLDFQEATIAAGLANRQYEGDLRSGNKVLITTATPVAIKNYKTGGSGGTSRGTSPDAVSSTQIELDVDQEKSFDFLVDDIDRAQAAGSLDAFTQSAGVAMAEDSDKFILSTAVTGADSGNVTTGTSALSAAANPGDAAFDVVRDLRKALNKTHTPQGGRVLLVNAEFEALLVSASSKLTAVNTSGSPAGLRDATVGGLLGFTVYTTENLPTTDVPQALAFHSSAVAYVSQIQETEAMRDTGTFSDRLRGLHVYGGKVIRPKSVAVYNGFAG